MCEAFYTIKSHVNIFKLGFYMRQSSLYNSESCANRVA